MSSVGQRAIPTQKRVPAFFRAALAYACLGNWKDREGNSNVEEELLAGWRREKTREKVLRLIGGNPIVTTAELVRRMTWCCHGPGPW